MSSVCDDPSLFGAEDPDKAIIFDMQNLSLCLLVYLILLTVYPGTLPIELAHAAKTIYKIIVV